MEVKNYHEKLRGTIDSFVHRVYDVALLFPKDEIFGLTSQYRRAALSIILNYVEDYARQRNAVLKNFLEISYGSAKESKYLTEFAHKRGYIKQVDHDILKQEIDEISKLLWGIISKL